MTREVHDVPPAPRRVRWRAVAWHRWPLALAGFLLSVYGGLFGLMFGFAGTGSLSRTDQKLTAGLGDGSTQRVAGLVAGVEAVPERLRGAGLEVVRFEYEHARAGAARGQCFAPAGRFRTGDRVTVEYDVAHGELSRIVGTRVTLVSLLAFARDWFGWVVAPGLCALLLWFGSVLRLRHLLAHGDVAAVEILSARAVRGVIPNMLAVQFQFRDHRAELRRGRHWVRQRSALGVRLGDEPRRLAVVHDRRHPRRCRLVLASDFHATPPVPAPDPAARSRWP
jgi:hypothetical protein